MKRIWQNEPTAARRRIPVRMMDINRNGVAGIGWAAADIQVSKNGGSEANSAGTVAAAPGNGDYYYEATQSECDTVGYLKLRAIAQEGALEAEFIALIDESPIVEAFSGDQDLTDTTEWSLTADSSTLQNQTTRGVYQVLLDMNGLGSGDSLRFRVYEKVRSGGTRRVVYEKTFATGAQDPPSWVSPVFALMHGWDMTLTMLAGSATGLEWSIRKVGAP